MSDHHHLYGRSAWRKLRRDQLYAEPLCRMCRELGRFVAAGVVDHVRAHRGDEELFFDPTNLQSLCKRCHDSHKQAQEHQADGLLRGAGLLGVPLDRAHPWHAAPRAPLADIGVDPAAPGADQSSITVVSAGQVITQAAPGPLASRTLRPAAEGAPGVPDRARGPHAADQAASRARPEGVGGESKSAPGGPHTALVPSFATSRNWREGGFEMSRTPEVRASEKCREQPAGAGGCV